MTFEWDEAKNKINLKKHGIDFTEAQTVFYDENGILFDDPEHSTDEERFIIIGKSIRSNSILPEASDAYREQMAAAFTGPVPSMNSSPLRNCWI